MKKIFLHTIALIILGNTLITIGEKTYYADEDLKILRQNFFSTKNDESFISLFPPSLLLTKMLIWLVAFSVITIVLHFLKIKHKKQIKNAVICFYVTSCLANVLIVPHPLWFVLGVFPICIVPFIIVENIILEFKKLMELEKITKTIEDNSWNLR